jgi:transketolase
MDRARDEQIALRYKELAEVSPYWEKTKDLVDQYIDIILNYRQSGHPGGSRSKVHGLLTVLLSGVMRWDIRHPEKRFGDRFVLVGGHTVPLIYTTLAVLNEAMRIKYEQTGKKVYELPGKRALLWEDLLGFRHRGGLSGHAEMEGKTLFLKFNTGPSGHGGPAAAGLALALKRAGADGVKVFAFEGEAGLTPGAAHETMNSAWGLALDNLYFVVDWNDFGIDDHPVSSVVYGTPEDWFASHGWRVFGAEFGSEWGPVSQAILSMVMSEEPVHRASPGSRPARAALPRYDNSSTVRHPQSRHFGTKVPFAEKYGVEFENFGGAAPTDPAALKAEFRANLGAVAGVLRRDQDLVDYLAERLVELGESVPAEIPSFRLGSRGIPSKDRLYDSATIRKPLRQRRLDCGLPWLAGRLGQRLHSASTAAVSQLRRWRLDQPAVRGAYGDYGTAGTAPWLDGEIRCRRRSPSSMWACWSGRQQSRRAAERESTGFWGACSTYSSFSYLKYGCGCLTAGAVAS